MMVSRSRAAASFAAASLLLLAGLVVARWLPADGTRAPELPAGAAGGVVRLDEPWLERGCAAGCYNAYLDFVERYGDHGGAKRRIDVGRLFDPPSARSPLPDDPESLRRAIVEALNVDFLLETMADRPIAVAVLDEQEEAAFTRRKLLIWEPAVGSFEGLLLLPHGDGPHPAILGLHGHRDSDRIFAREFMGEDLARAGYAVLVPRFRAHDCSRVESRIALTLLEHGFTLMGLRVYEALLTLEVLAAEPDVDRSRIGILGHSGGASTGNLLVRITGDRRPIAAYVTDYRVDYLNACGLWDVHCETVPALAPIASAVNDLDTLSVPHLVVPYRFEEPEQRTRILELFRRHLAPRPSAGEAGEPSRRHP